MIGNTLITLDKINSTNDYALRWYEEKHWPEGTIIRALDQFGTWAKKSDAEILCEKYVKTKEQLKRDRIKAEYEKKYGK